MGLQPGDFCQMTYGRITSMGEFTQTRQRPELNSPTRKVLLKYAEVFRRLFRKSFAGIVITLIFASRLRKTDSSLKSSQDKSQPWFIF